MERGAADLEQRGGDVRADPLKRERRAAGRAFLFMRRGSLLRGGQRGEALEDVDRVGELVVFLPQAGGFLGLGTVGLDLGCVRRRSGCRS